MLGRKIGHYHITRQIGKGGMGQVYEAVHEEIERRAAIKLLLPQFTHDAEAAARFLNGLRARNPRRAAPAFGGRERLRKAHLGVRELQSPWPLPATRRA